MAEKVVVVRMAEVPWPSINVLKRMLDEVETLISADMPMTENRKARCLELLGKAKALAERWKHVPIQH